MKTIYYIVGVTILLGIGGAGYLSIAEQDMSKGHAYVGMLYTLLITNCVLLWALIVFGSKKYTPLQLEEAASEAREVGERNATLACGEYWSVLIKKVKDGHETALAKKGEPSKLAALRKEEACVEKFRMYVEGVTDECRRDHRKRSHHVAKSRKLHDRLVIISNEIDDLVGK